MPLIAPTPPILPPLQPPDLTTLPRARLRSMRAAGEEVAECGRVLAKTGGNLVAELLRGQGPFYEWDHYPPGDVYDHETHAQYYYHAHRGNDAEHGHFHTFLRRRGMPPGCQPAALAGGGGGAAAAGGDDDPGLSHLIALSMDPFGAPMRLFATNCWVTGETWYAAEAVESFLDRFVIDHAYPSWPLNRWLSAMIRLFWPQIVALVRHRDQVVAAWQAAQPGVDALEDRALEITGSFDISIEAQIQAVEQALQPSIDRVR